MTSLYSERIAAVRDALPGWQVEGLLVTNMTNCAWLSGFTGSAGSLLITADAAFLATDSRYWEQALDQAPDFDLFKHSRRPQDTAVLLATAGVSAIGLEANHVTLQQAVDLEVHAGISWRHLDHPVEPMRRRKSAVEIAAIRAAAAISDAAMARLPILISPGIKESELAWHLEQQMREYGASGMAFNPIVSFGENSARPHHTPGDRPLQAGDIILVDMGARLNGFNSDLTRTFLYSESPDSRFLEIFDIVLDAQMTAVSGIRPGINSQEAHLLAADVITAAGYGDAFNHGLGHGLGLDVHEDPFLSATRPPQLIEQDMVLTIEPGIYLPGWGGVRIEDLVLVTPHGIEYISQFPKDSMLIVP